MAGVREAGPRCGGAVRPRLRLCHGRAHGRHLVPPRRPGGHALRGDPQGRQVAVRGPGVQGVQPRRREQAGDGEQRVGARAARPRRRGGRGPAGSVRDSAAGGRRCRGTAGAAAAAAAGVQRRRAGEPGERDAAAAAGAGADRAAGARGAGDGVLPAGPGLVPGQPRPDRQRLPVLAGPARPRPGDGVHPLRPGRHPGRSPHARDGAGPGSPLRALRLRGGRPGCAGRGQRVPAGAPLQPLVGYRAAHRGQPDLRLLARPGRVPGGALRRRRHVRQHRRDRMGADVGQPPQPVGPAGDARTSWPAARRRCRRSVTWCRRWPTGPTSSTSTASTAC